MQPKPSFEFFIPFLSLCDFILLALRLDAKTRRMSVRTCWHKRRNKSLTSFMMPVTYGLCTCRLKPEDIKKLLCACRVIAINVDSTIKMAIHFRESNQVIIADTAILCESIHISWWVRYFNTWAELLILSHTERIIFITHQKDMMNHHRWFYASLLSITHNIILIPKLLCVLSQMTLFGHTIAIHHFASGRGVACISSYF